MSDNSGYKYILSTQKKHLTLQKEIVLEWSYVEWILILTVRLQGSHSSMSPNALHFLQLGCTHGDKCFNDINSVTIRRQQLFPTSYK